MTPAEIQKNMKRIAELQSEMDAIRETTRQAFIEQMTLLFPEGLNEAPTTGKRGRPKGSTTRQPRSLESRFAVSLSRLEHSKAIPSVTPDREAAEAMLNTAASSVAAKNDVEVPEEIWQRIDAHLTAAYGPKEGKAKKGKG